jgi:acetolactate synthase-1/2/3 large subunit
VHVQLPAAQRRGPVALQDEELDSSFVGLTGGQIFHEMMYIESAPIKVSHIDVHHPRVRHHVKHIFGYPGGAILPVFDAIYESKDFDFILPRHEQGAGHMAEGYARVSGKPGIVLVTSGPGATNVITPMQDALSDGTPMIVFSGQVATSVIGSDAFQEADILGISRSCSKWNVKVNSAAELPRRINEAFWIATNGRPGPVLVDLPKDITSGILRHPIPLRYTRPELAGSILPFSSLDKFPRSHTKDPSSRLPQLPARDIPLLAQAASLITGAARPIICAGQGILSSPEGPKLLAKLAEKGNIPVTTTLMGLGAFDEHDSRALHMFGLHGAAYANLAMQYADVIISLGARFDDRVTGRLDGFAPAAQAAASKGSGGIIHFEIQPKNINKVVDATLAVEGDVVKNLAAMLPLLPDKPPRRSEWFERLDGWKKAYPFFYVPSKENEPLKPQEVIEELDRWCTGTGEKDRVVISTGVGQHQMWAAQHFRWTQPRTLVTSGGLGVREFCLILRADPFLASLGLLSIHRPWATGFLQR